MKMVDKEQTWTMLAGHFSQNDPDEEQIEKWLAKASAEEKQMYNEAKNIWDFTSGTSEDFEPDVDKAWKRVKIKRNMREKKPAFPLMKVAAAIVLLFVIGYIVNVQLNNDSSELIEVIAGSEVQYIVLPDGSEIWLNENTTLTYSPDFNMENREVFLADGEAFFHVKNAEGKRFTVYTEETKTEVIGTSFNVVAKKNEPVKVQVETGKVAFAARKDEESVFLTPGQEAIYQPEKDTVLSTVIEDLNFHSWQNNKLVFQNQDLETLIKRLEKKFNTTIFIKSPDLMNCRFTVTFNDPDIDKVLEILALTGDLEITKTNSGYEIDGEGCK